MLRIFAENMFGLSRNVHGNHYTVCAWHSFAVHSKYSVMQSYANSFFGDVALDTFKNVSEDEDNILDKIYSERNTAL